MRELTLDKTSQQTLKMILALLNMELGFELSSKLLDIKGEK